MNKALNTKITELLSSGKTVEDCVSFLTITEGDKYPTKVTARNDITELMETTGLIVKKTSKSGALKDWFMSLDDPTSTTSAQIHDKCVELDMKGGSVQYYVNSYKLAIDLIAKINK